MYKLIPAEHKHLDAMVEFIASTGYWLAIRQNNKLNLDPYVFLRDIVAPSYLPFTTLAVQEDDEEMVLGMMAGCSPSQSQMISAGFEHFNENAAKLLEPFLKFEDPKDAYEIKVLAVAKAYRRQGVAQCLFSLAEHQAKALHCKTLFLFIFGCQNNAIRLYLKNGMMIRNVILLDKVFPSREMLYLEKSSETEALLEYLDTSEAQMVQLFGA